MHWVKFIFIRFKSNEIENLFSRWLKLAWKQISYRRRIEQKEIISKTFTREYSDNSKNFLHSEKLLFSNWKTICAYEKSLWLLYLYIENLNRKINSKIFFEFFSMLKKSYLIWKPVEVIFNFTLGLELMNLDLCNIK